MGDEKYRVKVPDVKDWREMVKCQEACPVYTDSRGYVTALARGELELGFEISHDPNPLSTVCGRICGAPCETACRRGVIGPDFEPIAIRPMKRILTERHGPEAELLLPGSASADEMDVIIPLDQMRGGDYMAPPPEKRVMPGQGTETYYSQVRWSRRKLKQLAATPGRKLGKVAVIGAGPAGLTVAYDLALLGH